MYSKRPMSLRAGLILSIGGLTALAVLGYGFGYRERPQATVTVAISPRPEFPPVEESASAADAAVRAEVAGRPKSLDDVLYDMSLPKDKRRACPKHDGFREEFAEKFSKQQVEILGRIARYSDYTESEVWRLAAKSPQFLEAAEADFEVVYQPYQSASSLYHDRLLRVNDERTADRRFDVTMERPNDENGVIAVVTSLYDTGNKRPTFRVVRIAPGEDSLLDEASRKRQASKDAMAGFFNDMIRRFL